MDAAFFLRTRTRFIRWYYSTAVAPFREIQRKIHVEEAPYDEPPPSFDPECDEPPFLEEWAEAFNAEQVVGWSAVSLLADSLKLYFVALKQQLGFKLTEKARKSIKNKGLVPAYRKVIGEILETDWSDCPANFDIIEQVVLARNRAQHGKHLSILGARHDRETLKKHRELVFATEEERQMWKAEGADFDTLLAPRLNVTKENLEAAITEMEKLADWIEDQIPEVLARRYSRRQKGP